MTQTLIDLPPVVLPSAFAWALAREVPMLTVAALDKRGESACGTVLDAVLYRQALACTARVNDLMVWLPLYGDASRMAVVPYAPCTSSADAL